MFIETLPACLSVSVETLPAPSVSMNMVACVQVGAGKY